MYISKHRIDMHILGLEAVCVKTDNNTCKILPGTCYCALSNKTESWRLIEESYSNSILCVNKVIILMGILIQMFWNEVTQKYIVSVLNCSFTINKRANTNIAKYYRFNVLYPVLYLYRKQGRKQVDMVDNLQGSRGPQPK